MGIFDDPGDRDLSPAEKNPPPSSCGADTMSTTLELFWNLSSSKKKERLDATAKLVVTLHKFQSEFTPAEVSDEEISDSAQVDTLDTLNAQDVSYSIRRLIRGLASPRESSRLGFAVALTEVRLVVNTQISLVDNWCTKLLSRLDTVTCGQIMKLVLDASTTQGSMSGQEERDNLFARLFGITSIIHSGLIVRNGTLPTSSTSASSLESYELVIATLVALGEKKSWIRESAWWTLASAIETLAKSDVEWREQGVQVTLDTVYTKSSGWSPEKLALTLRLQALLPGKEWTPLLSSVFKGTDVLATQNLRVTANILKVRSRVLPNRAATLFFCRNLDPPRKIPRLERLLQEHGNPNYTSSGPSSSIYYYLKARTPPQGVPYKISGVWSLTVSFHSRLTYSLSHRHLQESLFSSISSPERKYWGFQLFQKALPRIRNSQDLPFLFTKNFMRSWINHLSKSDRYLHKAALSVVCHPYPQFTRACANRRPVRPRISSRVCKITLNWASH